MMILSRLFGQKSNRKRLATAFFESVSAQSRLPELYDATRISDTFDGRFEAITLHSALLKRRLNGLPTGGKHMFEDFSAVLFSSFDYAYREDGVGDLIVGKKMRKLGEAFVGRVLAYESALESGTALTDVIARNLLEGRETSETENIANYVRRADEWLAKLPDEDVLNARLSWPEPGLDADGAGS